MSQVERYIELTRKSAIKMRPVVPLGQPTAIGQVGVFDDDGAFDPLGTVEVMLGQGVGRLSAAGPPVTHSLSSGKKDVTLMNFGAEIPSGTFQGLGAAKAHVEIEFHSDESFVWAAKDITIKQIEQLQLLLNAMIWAYQLGSWRKDYVVITQIGVAKSFTALLSAGRGSKVLLGASGKAQTPAKATIADLSVGFKAIAESALTEKMVCKRNVVAFYQAVKVNESALDRIIGRDPHAGDADALMYEYREVGRFPKYRAGANALHVA